ncbi:hypothetical protein OPU71_05310 [Niveibacterium sp. 24ML]|uniref:DUF6600 domain-containing protein n=1 Tax=Niveibacterium sp. 24ML TaxID=2985512 RepID=UPI0022718A1D|nr:DUF6600 domain-containing protein [Niveibacterium sp. 24ML]MCX9155540.1 hypothetical protein [Niveibacterium sp. 24ML]
MRAAPRINSLRTWLLFCGAMLLAAAAGAQEPDPPGRVGRLSFIEGQTEAWTQDSSAWSPISLNTPITSGTGLWTAADGRAEVRIGSTAVRLDGDTQANFTRIDDHGLLLEVPRGVARVRLRTLADDDSLVLASGAIRVEAQRAGDYRIEHDPAARRVAVTVYSGRVRIAGVVERLTVLAGQRVELDLVSARLIAMGEAGHSGFDDWSERRDREQESAIAHRYVSPEMTGIEALDAHGQWEEDRRYGPLWYPVSVRAGWAPYRYGRWAWVAPWGWTWIDDAPWGFAPFHYGRWVQVGVRWAWAPGSYVARPVYAPALVGFYGGGPGVRVSVGIGPVVGWFPLAPFEVYRPHHHCTDTYIRRVNITHVTNITRVTPPTPGGLDGDYPRRPQDYRYGGRRDAATFIAHDDFVRSRPINAGYDGLRNDHLRSLPVGVPPGRFGGPSRPGMPVAGTPQPDGPQAPGGGRGAGGADGPSRPPAMPQPQPRLPGDERGDFPRYPIGARPQAAPLPPANWPGRGASGMEGRIPNERPVTAMPTPSIPIERDVRPLPAPPPGMAPARPSPQPAPTGVDRPKRAPDGWRFGGMPASREPGSVQRPAPIPMPAEPPADPRPVMRGSLGHTPAPRPAPQVPEQPRQRSEPAAERPAQPISVPAAQDGNSRRLHELGQRMRGEPERPRQPGRQIE